MRIVGSLTMNVLGIVAGVVLISGIALADHNEPLRARSMRGEFVTAYIFCSGPNSETTAPPLRPACEPAVRGDPVCGFGPKGKGKASLKVLDGDLEVKALLVGLDPGCEGEMLFLNGIFQYALDACAGGGSCTPVVLTRPLARCVVTNGKCKIKTTVNSEFPETLSSGARLGVNILGLRFMREDGSIRTFELGLFVP